MLRRSCHCWSRNRRRGACKHSQARIPKCWCGGDRKWNAFRLWPASSAPIALDVKGLALVCNRLTQLANGWHEVEPGAIVRENAVRFLRVHPLRAADSLQLAAAFVAAEGRPASLQVVTLDERLADAARKEGF